MRNKGNFLIVSGNVPVEYHTADGLWAQDPMEAEIFPTWRKAANAARKVHGFTSALRFHMQPKGWTGLNRHIAPEEGEIS